jgi:putative PIN family toxin of toxin-antitoxin system
MPLAVFDTNVLIASLISAGKPRALWNLVLEGKLQLVLSKQLLSEFVRVVARPKFKRYVTSRDVELFLKAIKDISYFVRVRHSFKAIEEDPSDNIVLNTAYDAKADYIVSGDTHLLKLKEFKGIKIVTAAKMLEILRKK